MAKSVDATDLKSVEETHAGSSPAVRTKLSDIRKLLSDYMDHEAHIVQHDILYRLDKVYAELWAIETAMGRYDNAKRRAGRHRK